MAQAVPVRVRPSVPLNVQASWNPSLGSHDVLQEVLYFLLRSTKDVVVTTTEVLCLPCGVLIIKMFALNVCSVDSCESVPVAPCVEDRNISIPVHNLAAVAIFSDFAISKVRL